jgi:DNA-binding transcriptional MerR regulator
VDCLLQDDLKQWAQQVQSYRLPRYDELPAIDLYMDQVVAILEDCLRLFLRDAQEKRITPAMINNYVKLKVLPPPVKKRYTRDHLCQLILICLLKQVLSLPEIQRLLSAQLESKDVRTMYDGFCTTQERSIASVLGRAVTQADGDLSDMALRIAAEANVGKMIAEKILDVSSPPPAREKKRERE